MTLKRVAIVFFFLWLIHNIYRVSGMFWPPFSAEWIGGCLGGILADPIMWALGIGIVVLRYREGSWWGRKAPVEKLTQD